MHKSDAMELLEKSLEMVYYSLSVIDTETRDKADGFAEMDVKLIKLLKYIDDAGFGSLGLTRSLVNMYEATCIAGGRSEANMFTNILILRDRIFDLIVSVLKTEARKKEVSFSVNFINNLRIESIDMENDRVKYVIRGASGNRINNPAIIIKIPNNVAGDLDLIKGDEFSNFLKACLITDMEISKIK